MTALNATDDGGVTWDRIGAYGAGADDIGWVHPDIQDLHVLGEDVWVASDGGLNHSTDELTTHTSRKYGIYNTTLWGFSQGWNTDVQTGGRYHNGNTAFRQDFGTGLHLRLDAQRDVHGHLIAVEIGVERGADQRVQLDRFTLDQHRVEGLNAKAMESWRPVQQHRMLADHFFEDVPHLGPLFFDAALEHESGRQHALMEGAALVCS